jgi:hypothetical protein
MEKRPKMPDKHRCVRPFVGDGSNELTDANLRLARKRWGPLKPQSVQNLKTYSQEFGFSITAGDLILLDNGWHVTNTGLIRLARRKHCGGIDVKPVAEFSSTNRWSVGIPRYCLQVPQLSRFCWLRRCRSLQCLSPGPWRRDARRRDPGGQPGPAQGLRHRHLLGRGDRVVC